MTLRLPIKTLLAYQRNQIYSEASSTHFSVVNLSYTCDLPIIILIDPNKLQTFQKSIWLIAEHSLIWHFRLPIKTLLAYQRNQIYSEASSTHFSAINLSYFTLYPLNSSWIYIKYPTFQKTIRLVAEHSLIWHFRLPIKTLLASQRNQIYSEASSTHFSDVNLTYTHALRFIILINPNKSQTFQNTIRVIAEHNSIWHCDLLIKTLLASQRNQIYSEASSTHFSAINLSYFTLYPLNSSWIYIKYPTFQKTIRVIVEHNSIWQSVIYQSKHFSPPNANKYILKHLQHTFQLLIYHPSRFTHQNPYGSKYITTFQKTIRLVAGNSLIWHFRLPIKRLLASQRNQIYSEASSTHFSAVNLSYNYALPIIVLIDPNKLQTFQKSIRLIAEHNSI